MRNNPRKAWYDNVDEVTTNGDYEATFHLKRPQPALLALLASGYSPIYPCHVSPAQMRTHPIGTGPFKFVEFKPNESIKLTRNPDYWKQGLPYLDGIEYTIIPNRSTAILAFVAGKFDMTFPTEVTIPLLEGRQDAGAERGLRDRADQRHHQPHRQLVETPPFDNPDICAARWRWRSTARRSSTSCSRARAISAAPCCRRRRAVGHAAGDAGDHSGLRPRRQRKPRSRRAADHEKLGYGPDKHARGQGLDPQYSRSTAIRR